MQLVCMMVLLYDRLMNDTIFPPLHLLHPIHQNRGTGDSPACLIPNHAKDRMQQDNLTASNAFSAS